MHTVRAGMDVTGCAAVLDVLSIPGLSCGYDGEVMPFWVSMVSTHTRSPSWAQPSPKAALVVVFPTPPDPQQMTI